MSLDQVQHGNANACQLLMNPGSDLDSLPVLDMPDTIVVRAFASLIGELLYIAINTMPQLSYSMSCLTRYMFKATQAHLTYERWCCVILLASRTGSSRGVANGYLCLIY